MGWVTISLRKIALTRRVDELENRLMQISQDNQSLSNSSAYAQRALGIRKQDAMSSLMSNYMTSVTGVQDSISSTDSSDVSAMMQYQVELSQAQLDYMYNSMVQSSIFTMEEQALQEQVNNKQTALDTLQEQVETQLEAARAELQQLDDAKSSDIEQSTISLV